MSSRSSRFNVWNPTTPHLDGRSGGVRNNLHEREDQSATSGTRGTKPRVPQQQPEYSPLHMRLLNCPGGTCPSMAMRLEMELEYAERRAKCIRRSQCHNSTRWSADLHAGRIEGNLRSRASPFSDSEDLTVRRGHPHSDLQRTSTAVVGSHRKPSTLGRRFLRQDGCKARFLTSSDAISDDVSTCAGTGSLQSVGGVPSALSTVPPGAARAIHEVLPLTRLSRRRLCVPKPRARPATKSDRLCPPCSRVYLWRFNGAMRLPNKRVASHCHENSQRDCSPTRSSGTSRPYTTRTVAKPMYSPGRDQFVAARYITHNNEEARATLRVTRTTPHVIQARPAPARLRRTSCVASADLIADSSCKAQAIPSRCMPSADHLSANGRRRGSLPMDHPETVPRTIRRHSVEEKRQRMRRFKSCTSVGIIKSLVRRHARRLVGARAQAGCEEFDGGEIEAEAAICLTPKYTSATFSRTQNSPTCLVHRSTESASSRLYVSQGVTEASKASFSGSYRSTAESPPPRDYLPRYSRLDGCRRSVVTDSEEEGEDDDDDDEDYDGDDDDEDEEGYDM